MNPIRIGVIGAGGNSRGHLQALTALDAYEVSGIADVVLPAAQQRAAEFGLPHAYGHPDEVLNDPNIDAVLISVPNRFHAPLSIRALQEGKHVIVEKPLASDLASARLVAEAQRESGKLLMVAQQRRWEPVHRQVKEQADKGALGRIYYAKAGWMRRKGIPGWGTWFTRKSESGGGALLDIGVHVLDLAMHLLGNPRPVSVYGATYAELGPRGKGTGGAKQPDPNGYCDVEELAVAMIRFENGSTLSLETSWAAPLDTDNRLYVQLFGTEGGASIVNGGGKWIVERFDASIEADIAVPRADPNDTPRIHMYRHFAECVRTGTQPDTNIRTGFTNQLIIDAIYESARTGREVVLQEADLELTR
ncbi:MAG: oxidoreductase [Paenibacillus sp.]|nr:oxidoreductase [Paenibacillus sp.]